MDAGASRVEIAREWTADDVLDRLDWLDAREEAQAAMAEPAPSGMTLPGGVPFNLKKR